MFLSRGQKTTLPSVLPCDISPLSHSSYKLETIAGVQQMKCSSLCLWQQWFHTLQVLTLKCQHNNSMARNPLLCDTAVLVFFYCWRYIHSFIHSSRSNWGITRYSHSCWGAVWQVGCRRCEWKLPTEFVPDFNLTDLPFVIIFLDISRQFPAPIFRSLFGSSVHTTFSSHSKKPKTCYICSMKIFLFSNLWRSVSFFWSSLIEQLEWLLLWALSYLLYSNCAEWTVTFKL